MELTSLTVELLMIRSILGIDWLSKCTDCTKIWYVNPIVPVTQEVGAVCPACPRMASQPVEEEGTEQYLRNVSLIALCYHGTGHLTAL